MHFNTKIAKINNYSQCIKLQLIQKQKLIKFQILMIDLFQLLQNDLKKERKKLN